MKLRDLIMESKPTRTCEYLKSIGVEFEKTQTEDGAKFEVKGKTPKEVKNIVDDILSVPEITKHFDIGYAGGKTIVVTFG